MHLPFTYPQNSASLFAANDLARSAFVAGRIMLQGRCIGASSVKGFPLLAGLTCGYTDLLYLL